jgi:hypothetical protein
MSFREADPGMLTTNRLWRIGKAVLAAAILGPAAFAVLLAPASAQFFNDRYPFQQRRFLDFIPDEKPPVDYSRAPAPKKTDTQPTTKIVVFGDSLADWLAYGLEDALSETPEIGIVRKHRAFSGLIRYESRSDAEWPQVARDAIAAEKPQAIVVLLGVQDRQPIREKVPTPAKPGQPEAGNAANDHNADADDSEQTPTIAAPEPQRGRTSGTHEYRSERWEQLYSKKIDDMIAVLKSANVPVLWVGLPSIRGARSTSDAQYLNELYRAAADRAGIMYVDVWDGFVDEQGRYTTRGPDVEGQIRALRAPDGVHFTKHGARKIAHYVERELRRVLTAPMPVALTAPADTQPQVQKPVPGAPATPAARPLAGPVLFLASPPHEEELLGSPTARPKIDEQAARVLVKGEVTEASAGRADDFSWPPRTPNIVVTEPLPPSGAPIYASKPLPKPAEPKVAEPRAAGGTRVAGQPVLQGHIQPQRPQGAPPPFWRRPPPAWQDRPRGGFFGLFGGRW